jgi:hypothetical protein
MRKKIYKRHPDGRYDPLPSFKKDFITRKQAIRNKKTKTIVRESPTVATS